MKFHNAKFICLAIVLVGCAVPVTNAHRFQNFVNQYKNDPTPKVLYVAYNNIESWAFGKAVSAGSLDQAHEMARRNCENARVSHGVTDQCAPYYVNNDFVYGLQPVQAESPSPSRVKKPTPASGTCFAVNPSGMIVTANHIVDGRSNFTVSFPDGREFDAQLASSSVRIDVAILTVDEADIPWIPFAPSRSYQSGDYVFVLGYPARSLLGDEVKFTDGSISALSGLGSEGAFMQISAPAQPGNSGGPVLTDSGEVVGVLVSSAAILHFIEETGSLPQNINWATNIDFVRPLLPSDVPSIPLNGRREAIDRARQATCIIDAN